MKILLAILIGTTTFLTGATGYLGYHYWIDRQLIAAYKDANGQMVKSMSEIVDVYNSQLDAGSGRYAELDKQLSAIVADFNQTSAELGHERVLREVAEETNESLDEVVSFANDKSSRVAELEVQLAASEKNVETLLNELNAVNKKLAEQQK